MKTAERPLVDWVALLVSVALVVLIGTGARGVTREWIAVSFALTVPGWIVVSYLRLADAAVEATLAFALSITIGTAVSMVAFWAHLFNPTGITADLAGASALMLAQRKWRARRRGRMTAVAS